MSVCPKGFCLCRHALLLLNQNFIMPFNFPTRKIRLLAAASVVAFGGCAVNLPPSPAPASNPANSSAAEAATAPLRPTLLATSRTFLSPQAGDREQTAKQRDISEVKDKAMQPGMIDESHLPNATLPERPPIPTTAEASYTCPMHPQIDEAKPGQCPICGMTLIKKTGATEGAKP